MDKKYIVEIISRSQQSFETKATDERHAVLNTIAFMLKNGYLSAGREQVVSFLVRDRDGEVYLQAPLAGLDTDDTDYDVLEIIDKLGTALDVEMLRDYEEDDDF